MYFLQIPGACSSKASPSSKHAVVDEHFDDQAISAKETLHNFIVSLNKYHATTTCPCMH